ncbi:GntR family transcriptional regulator [Lacipirellula parvula]|uniref:Transcriptional regulator n=1 Tax=Lacipirellula parvula TaxID=2650471 RepID=A0A5K7XGA2_9BACT|nr:GntR family transcriptional regulator [Lacipirellula parvula]BBO33306.1 transcriptional regulator [Lacipirellula parvula]
MLKATTIELPEASTVDDAQQSRVDDVYHGILARIVRGELPGGSELKSTQLAQALGVSRTPVVQALSRLIADGIVTQKMNMRAMVRPGAENWLVEIHELRLLLEPPAAARAAQHMPIDAIQRLQRQSDAVDPQNDDDWVRRARDFDFALHLAISEHAANQPLRGAINKCWEYKRLSYTLGPERTDAVLRGLREHRTILGALAARDSATASAAMELHLRLASSYRPAGRVV